MVRKKCAKPSARERNSNSDQTAMSHELIREEKEMKKGGHMPDQLAAS